MSLNTCISPTTQLISLDTALSNIYDTIKPVDAHENIPLATALGRVLADDLYSPANLPSACQSAMDGYAFSSKDLVTNDATLLTLVGTSWAGNPFDRSLNSNECVRIFTGANVPSGADSIAVQECVTVTANQVQLPANLSVQQHIRKIGEDVQIGQLLLQNGKLLSPADLSLLAATGFSHIPVKRRLNIGFFSTGDELKPLGSPLSEGQIYDSNRYLLGALLEHPYFAVNDLGILPDDLALLQHTVQTAAQNHDVLLSTGGVSVGAADHIKTVLERCGTIHFWRIAIKPGKPLAFGKIDNCYFLGLPGNPAAVFTTFKQIVLPALQHYCGIPPRPALRFYATCLTNIKKSAGRQEFQRGLLRTNPEHRFTVEAIGAQGSNILSTTAQANCFIILAAESNGALAGEQVLVEPFATYL